MLFLFYEFFGVVTNLVGGWLGARMGFNQTMHIGMAIQVFAVAMLTVPDAWLSVACLWVSTAFLLLAGILSIRLPEVATQPRTAGFPGPDPR